MRTGTGLRVIILIRSTSFEQGNCPVLYATYDRERGGYTVFWNMLAAVEDVYHNVS